MESRRHGATMHTLLYPMLEMARVAGFPRHGRCRHLNSEKVVATTFESFHHILRMRIFRAR